MQSGDDYFIAAITVPKIHMVERRCMCTYIEELRTKKPIPICTGLNGQVQLRYIFCHIC